MTHAVSTAAAPPAAETRDPQVPRGGSRALYRSIPLWVWLVAVLAGVVHMAPYWRAAAQTPDGWTFTANLSASPDYMQYRVWMRQTQEEGILISNRFTAEHNGRHLPVLLYWGIGQAAAVTGMSPEWVYAWLGGVLAIVFTLVLFAVVRMFAPGPRATAWILGTLLAGGGLGGYLKLIEDWEWARGFALLNMLLFRPFTGPNRVALFEDYRGNYIVQALFDTHFLVFWLVTTVAVLALYLTIRRFSPLRLAATATLFAFGTFLHVYEGLTLMFIAMGALLMCWRKGLPARTALLIGGSCAVAVGLCLMAVVVVARLSGAAAPVWRGLHVLPSILLLAYPLAWALMAWRGIRYWTEAGMDEAFLVGWALGCLALIGMAPFFPYPDRGTMTLQIPLFIIAGSIFFAARQRPGLVGALAVALLLGSTPVWMTKSWITRTTFDAQEQHKWLSAGHTALAGTLTQHAGVQDILLAREIPLRWLAPEYRGRHYAGHFFLTTRYERKQRRMAEFYETMDADQRAEFLRSEGIRWVYADTGAAASDLASVPGLRAVDRRPFGTLYEFVAERPAAATAQ
jgi:hypothetical protein